jgi:hypothetical protein
VCLRTEKTGAAENGFAAVKSAGAAEMAPQQKALAQPKINAAPQQPRLDNGR